MWDQERPPSHWASSSSLAPLDEQEWVDRRWAELKGPLSSQGSFRTLALNTQRSSNPILQLPSREAEETETRDWVTSSQLAARGRSEEKAASLLFGFTKPTLSRDASADEVATAGHAERLQWMQERGRPASAVSSAPRRAKQKPKLCMSGSGILLHVQEPKAPEAAPPCATRQIPSAEDLDALLLRRSRSRNRPREYLQTLDVINPLNVNSIRTGVTMGGTRHQSIK